MAIKLGLVEVEKFSESRLKETGKWLLPSKETTVEEKQDVNFNVRGLRSCQCSLLHIAIELGDDAQRPDKGEVVVWLPST